MEDEIKRKRNLKTFWFVEKSLSVRWTISLVYFTFRTEEREKREERERLLPLQPTQMNHKQPWKAVDISRNARGLIAIGLTSSGFVAIGIKAHGIFAVGIEAQGVFVFALGMGVGFFVSGVGLLISVFSLGAGISISVLPCPLILGLCFSNMEAWLGFIPLLLLPIFILSFIKTGLKEMIANIVHEEEARAYELFQRGDNAVDPSRPEEDQVLVDQWEEQRYDINYIRRFPGTRGTVKCELCAFDPNTRMLDVLVHEFGEFWPHSIYIHPSHHAFLELVASLPQQCQENPLVYIRVRSLSSAELWDTKETVREPDLEDDGVYKLDPLSGIVQEKDSEDGYEMVDVDPISVSLGDKIFARSVIVFDGDFIQLASDQRSKINRFLSDSKALIALNFFVVPSRSNFFLAFLFSLTELVGGLVYVFEVGGLFAIKSHH